MLASFTCGGIFDLESKQKKVKELEVQMESQDFWDNKDNAQATIQSRNELREWLDPYNNLKQRYQDAASLLPEAIELGDEGLETELREELDAIEKGISELEIRKMLSGRLDSKNAYLTINAGAGGTEACDWVLMLSRMYQRWGERRGWKVSTVDFLDGDVAGLKSITLKYDGPFAYGYAKSEIGVHRLVRISPFDSNAKRHTSFASVDVTPEVTDDIKIDVRPDEIRVDTFRSSGAGGQHVNTTDSAVRMTHIPTGVVVSCQGERSQIKNRETCMKMLYAKLFQLEEMERQKEMQALGGEKKKIEWGSQIRNYVFQPYTLVKDTRTKVENGNVQAVMDGDLDLFVNAYLKEFG